MSRSRSSDRPKTDREETIAIANAIPHKPQLQRMRMRKVSRRSRVASYNCTHAHGH